MFYELFGVNFMLREKFFAGHPHESVDFAGLRYKGIDFGILKRYLVNIVIFVVEIGAAVQHTFVCCLE